MGQPLQSFIVIMGDFNTPDVDWSTLSASSEFSSKLCDLEFLITISLSI